MIALQLLLQFGVMLVTDFGFGVCHWWGDAYGDPFWRVPGTRITRPNILHHYAARVLLETSWWNSVRALLVITVAMTIVVRLAGALS